MIISLLENAEAVFKLYQQSVFVNKTQRINRLINFFERIEK